MFRYFESVHLVDLSGSKFQFPIQGNNPVILMLVNRHSYSWLSLICTFSKAYCPNNCRKGAQIFHWSLLFSYIHHNNIHIYFKHSLNCLCVSSSHITKHLTHIHKLLHTTNSTVVTLLSWTSEWGDRLLLDLENVLLCLDVSGLRATFTFPIQSLVDWFQ